jgi:DNA repair protein RecO (recombination protein O)
MRAIVLSKKDFRESDQLTTLYTEDRGKIELLSRGIKKIVSKQAAFLMPFSLVEIEIAQGQEIDHLIRTQPIRLFKNIRMNLKKSLMADYVVKLVDQLTVSNERDERIFNLLVSWLEFIEQIEVVRDSLVISFISKLLHYLGFEPVLDRCLIHDEKMSEILFKHQVYFSPSAGGIICENCTLHLQKNEVILSLLSSDFENFKLLYSENWEVINQIELSPAVINAVYQFTTYQTERKVANWFDFSKTLA